MNCIGKPPTISGKSALSNVQKQEQRGKSEGRESLWQWTRTLLADLWDSLGPGDDRKNCFAAWSLARLTTACRSISPESDGCSLPDANDFLDASSVFFHLPGAAKKKRKKIFFTQPCARGIGFTSAWQQKILGSVTMPKTERAARELVQWCKRAIESPFVTKASELASQP